jgi:protein CpxP
MNRIHTTLLAATLAVLGSSAMAQAQVPATAPGAMHQGHHGHHGRHYDPAKMQERHAQRLAELKQKLQITAAQEPAWNNFTSAVRPNLDRKRMDRDAVARMSTPDRIDHMRVLRQQRAAEMDRRGEATKAFYATLTPEQQKVFDAETARMGHGRKHGGHGHRG